MQKAYRLFCCVLGKGLRTANTHNARSGEDENGFAEKKRFPRRFVYVGENA